MLQMNNENAMSGLNTPLKQSFATPLKRGLGSSSLSFTPSKSLGLENLTTTPGKQQSLSTPSTAPRRALGDLSNVSSNVIGPLRGSTTPFAKSHSQQQQQSTAKKQQQQQACARPERLQPSSFGLSLTTTNTPVPTPNIPKNRRKSVSFATEHTTNRSNTPGTRQASTTTSTTTTTTTAEDFESDDSEDDVEFSAGRMYGAPAPKSVSAAVSVSFVRSSSSWHDSSSLVECARLCGGFGGGGGGGGGGRRVGSGDSFAFSDDDDKMGSARQDSELQRAMKRVAAEDMNCLMADMNIGEEELNDDNKYTFKDYLYMGGGGGGGGGGVEDIANDYDYYGQQHQRGGFEDDLMLE